jgi:REP element-mobilizing transposase RayT
MNRGDRRDAIFLGDEDRRRFLRTLGEACQRTRWQVHAYCLMRNHFHLVVETPAANLVVGMHWLLGTCTTRFNLRHRRCGHLFSGRSKALIVDGSANGYLRTVMLLHQNGWEESDLHRVRKADPAKVRMALQLRRETTVTWKWIATRLQMGAWRSARNAVAALKASAPPPPP